MITTTFLRWLGSSDVVIVHGRVRSRSDIGIYRVFMVVRCGLWFCSSVICLLFIVINPSIGGSLLPFLCAI
jgi:hypothetical protein